MVTLHYTRPTLALAEAAAKAFLDAIVGPILTKVCIDHTVDYFSDE
jgi:hypothetical protein